MSEAQSDMSSAPARGRSVKGAHALDSIDFRSRTTGEQAAARSRLVRRLRVALPIFAGVLLLVLIFNTRTNQNDDAFLEDFKSITATTEELRTTNPRFAGIDEDGKPFEITAAAASQSQDDGDNFYLEKPRAVQGAAGEGSLVTAERGRYNSDENVLELSDDVTLRHELGAKTFVLTAPSAIVLVKEQVVTSDAGVGGVGPDGGELKADRMKAYRDDGRVVFQGNVSMRIYPKKNEDAADKPSLREGSEGETEE